MKRRKKILALTLAFALILGSGARLQTLALDTEEGAVDTAAEVSTGIQVVDGEFCFYSENGELDEEKTNELREAAQVETEIDPLLKLIGEPNDTEYFGQGCWFGESGEETGEDGAWYYDNFQVYVYKTEDNTYFMGAEALTTQKSDFRSMLAALVEHETAAASSPEVELKALFQYVEDEYSYERKVGFEPYDGWQEDYAAEMLSDMAGSCYHYAALYAFLAKEATDYEVRICTGTTDGFSATSWQPHAWTEIEIDGKWYVFDTNLDKYEADSALKYYMLDTDSDLYEEIYKVEDVYEVSLETTAEDGGASGAGADTEDESEALTAAATETEDTAEDETEAETEDETEAETESETSTEVKVDEEGEDVLTLDNRTGLTFTEAHLAGDVLTLVDEEGEEHTFSEVDKDDIGSPHLVVYGSFLAIKYTSAKTGKAGRLTEEGDEIVFDVPQTMTVISTAYVRSGAGLDCDKITVADKGAEIKVLAETGKWFRISLKDGREGYISKVAVIVEENLSSTETSQGEQETETETEPVPEMVVVEEDGEYYRYLRFTPAEDTIVKINGEPCYVMAGGTVSEGWKVLGDKLYYSDAEGRLKSSETYEGIRFGRNGAALDSTNVSLKKLTLQIVNSITDDTMTQREKLSACWSYVTRGHISYAGKYPDLNAEGWQRAMALNVLSSGSGNCYGFACAFAALAEEIGYDPEVVCGRVSGSRDGAADGMTRHSWVMINGYHYDPEAQWAGWCAGIYGYGSYPVAHSVQKVVAF